jgi:hypothetical protein
LVQSAVYLGGDYRSRQFPSIGSGMSASTVNLQYHRKGTAFAESHGDFNIPFDESGAVDGYFAPVAQEYKLISDVTR